MVQDWATPLVIKLPAIEVRVVGVDVPAQGRLTSRFSMASVSGGPSREASGARGAPSVP
jgi:uncharacterized protein YqfA (UPF0365 family)